MPRKTTLEKIAAIQTKISALGKKIVELQEQCPHALVSADCRIVGFNEYSNDYQTTCQCQNCHKSWFHDGWCDGRRHVREGR